MSKFVAVAKTSELQPGEMSRVNVDQQPVLLANVDGTFFALLDRCGHQRAALSKGRLKGETVECPMHFSRFNVKTGRLIRGPDYMRLIRFREALRLMGRLSKEPRVLLSPRYFWTEDVPAYEVRIEGDTVLVKV